jgi:hypothetical protein
MPDDLAPSAKIVDYKTAANRHLNFTTSMFAVIPVFSWVQMETIKLFYCLHRSK